MKKSRKLVESGGYPDIPGKAMEEFSRFEDFVEKS